MEFKELIAGFAAKYGIEGLSGADGAAELKVDDVRVELLDDPQTHSIFACAEIGHPPPDVTLNDDGSATVSVSQPLSGMNFFKVEQVLLP